MTFFDAHRAWSARVRTLRHLPAQYLRVAWAIGERFNSQHGVAYASLEDYGALAGGVDRRDVSRAIDALVRANCLAVLYTEALVAIIGASPGRPPRGLRMIVDRDADVGDADELVLRADAPDPAMRFAARTARGSGGAVPPKPTLDLPDHFGGAVPPQLGTDNGKSFGGAVSPKSQPSSGAITTEGFGGAAPTEFRGRSARPIDEPLLMGGAYRAPPYTESGSSFVAEAIGEPAGAPKGAGLTDDELFEADLFFGELFEEERQALAEIKHAVGADAFADELRLVIASGRWCAIKAWGAALMNGGHRHAA